jgi:adenylate cyclase
LRRVNPERVTAEDVAEYVFGTAFADFAGDGNQSPSQQTTDTLIERHHGRFVNSAGDSVLAEFASVLNAVQCGIEIQSALKAENAGLRENRRMQFRIGINLGDVIVDGDQIYGDGVNVAAHLESLAEPGGICISHTVHDQIGNKLALSYDDLGEQQVKNIAKPVRVLRLLLDGAPAQRKSARSGRSYWRGGALSLTGLAIIAVTFVVVQHLSLRPPHSHASIPPAAKPALALPKQPSIAVLPFDNLSGDPQQEYFSDGITDDLITDLSRLPGLFVIARTSSFSYKAKPAKLQTWARNGESSMYYRAACAEMAGECGSRFNWPMRPPAVNCGQSATTGRCGYLRTAR